MHGGQSVPFEGMLQLMTVIPWPPITLLAAELLGVKIQTDLISLPKSMHQSMSTWCQADVTEMQS